MTVEHEKKQSKVVTAGIPVFILLALLWLVFFTALDDDKTVVPSQRQDRVLPNFSAPLLLNPEQSVSSTRLRGEYRLLNVWGSWCPSCYAEHPFFMELQQEGIKIVGINYKDTREKGIQFLKQLGDPYEFTFFDPKGRIAIEMGITAAPETFLIDKEGVVRAHRIGAMDRDIWQQQFLPIINEEQTP